MQCLEFRRAAGGDPGHLSAEAQAHADACAACAGYLGELRAQDRTILRALQVPVPAEHRMAAASKHARATPRRRWYALAASILGGVLIGTLLFTSGPRQSIAKDAVDHVNHEPHALVVTQTPADPKKLAGVLNRAGLSLRPGIGTVSYAKTCWFRGRRVPHLVVQTDTGPVTVMVLRNEIVPEPVNFTERGFAGKIIPAGPGSIAIIGDDDAELTQISQRVTDAVIWQRS